MFDILVKLYMFIIFLCFKLEIYCLNYLNPNKQLVRGILTFHSSRGIDNLLVQCLKSVFRIYQNLKNTKNLQETSLYEQT